MAADACSPYPGHRQESGAATALLCTLLAVCFLPATNPNKLCLSLRRLLGHHLVKLPKLRSAKAVAYRLRPTRSGYCSQSSGSLA